MPDGAERRVAPRPRRPSIGLALGGGAARGWAHIGVIRQLVEAGFAPDVIAGTSIGAVVGGCYAAGGLDELESFARDLSKRRVIGLLDFHFGGSGLITGDRLAKLLMRGFGDTRIEDLPRRFVCVSTELRTGHEIWLSKGELVQSMRASYALPGLFKPVRVLDRWLIDGALVNPVPVSVCRAFGARLVIAINLNTDMFGKGTVVRAHDPVETCPGDTDADWPDEAHTGVDGARGLLRRQLVGTRAGPPGISSVMVDAFNIVQDRIARSRLAGDPPDIMVTPKLADIGMFEFHRAREAIDAGARAGDRILAEIEGTLTALAR
ncbi:MAG: patatin-like phospholipase family protein [Hyphomicrobiales bacterium]|nr:patatin-like phospholipase family protein [Hyphomicrobiales bacterium]